MKHLHRVIQMYCTVNQYFQTDLPVKPFYLYIMWVYLIFGMCVSTKNKHNQTGLTYLILFFINALLPPIVETQQGLHFDQSIKDTGIVVVLSLYLYNRPTLLQDVNLLKTS